MKIFKSFPSFIAGSLAVLALPPFYIAPVLFISFSVLFNNLQKAESRWRAFWTAWWFGFGYFIFGLYWIANSLFVDIDKFWWLVPFSVAGIPFGLAFFIGAFGYIYKYLSEKIFHSTLSRIFIFAGLWTIFEILRNYIPFGGFPWNLVGYASLFSIEFSQIASIGGVFVLSFIIVYLALVPFGYRSKIYLSLYFAIILGGFLYGNERLNDETGGIQKNIRIIQPNIPQSLKWDPMESGNQYMKTLNIAQEGDISKFDLIIWPESGAPYHLNREELVLGTIQNATPEKGLTITGAIRSTGSHQDYKIWNTAYIVSKNGIEAFYDKAHLVPFGEYVPFRKYLPIDKITPGSMDFSEGESHQVIKVNNLKFLPLICYEVIFPQLSFSKEIPDYIINITNDGWFGNSTGPRQHLAMTQMRAIEQGVPVLRSANTGVSAIINGNGVIINFLDYDRSGVIDYSTPLKHYDKTIYGSCGDLAVLLLISFITLFSFLLRKPQFEA